ncbi:MAG: hypothetical protein ACRDV9_01205 [Acidimicrobiia bacterium]
MATAQRASTRLGAASAALVLAVAAAVLLTLLPMSSSSSVTVSGEPGGGTVTRTTTSTLLENEGASILAVLAVPIAFAGAGLLAARRSRRRVLTAVTVLYGTGVVLALASVGIFFLPSLGALIVARIRA